MSLISSPSCAVGKTPDLLRAQVAKLAVGPRHSGSLSIG